jgi:hypothetical protein
VDGIENFTIAPGEKWAGKGMLHSEFLHPKMGRFSGRRWCGCTTMWPILSRAGKARPPDTKDDLPAPHRVLHLVDKHNNVNGDNHDK